MYKDMESVDAIIDESRDRQVLIMKHSSACGTSARAKREMDVWLEDNPGREIYLVVVQQQRDISNELEAKLGIRHETPQLLMVRDGQVTQHWSHYGIRGEDLDEAINT